LPFFNFFFGAAIFLFLCDFIQQQVVFYIKMATTTEDLQTLVLTTLDKENVIQDSKTLTHNEKPVDQLALLGALNSLKSKDVNISSTLSLT
jgi:hypothetical protein